MWVLALVACGSEHRDAEGRASEPVPAITVAPVTRVELPSFYDADGRLLASDEHVAGLSLPVGLTPLASDARTHSYTTTVPIARVVAYFGPRLTTGSVEPRAGGGACYRAATAREATGSTVRMDVMITPVPGERTMIEIREIPPEPVSPPSEAESIARLQDAITHGD